MTAQTIPNRVAGRQPCLRRAAVPSVRSTSTAGSDRSAPASKEICKLEACAPERTEPWSVTGGRYSMTRNSTRLSSMDVSNQNLKAAVAQYQQARAAVRYARARLLPEPDDQPFGDSRRVLEESAGELLTEE